MRKILVLISVITATLGALHSKAAEPLFCRSAHSSSVSAKPLALKSFKDAMDTRAYDAIWAQAKADMLKEIAGLPKAEQEQIKQAAQDVQDYVDMILQKGIIWKKRNGTKENSVVYDYRSRMDDLKEDLRVGLNPHSYGTQNLGVGLYKKLFHDVESSYLKIKENADEMTVVQKYGRTLEEIKSQSSLRTWLASYLPSRQKSPEAVVRLEQLRAENQKLYRTFGRHLEEYTAVRLYLENVAKQDPILLSDPMFTDLARSGAPLTPPHEIAESAQNILSQLGVSGVEQRSPFLNAPRERISLDAIHDLYARTPEIQIEKLQYEYRANRDVFLRSAAVIVFANYIRKVVYKFPNEGKFKFVRQSLEVFTRLVERRYLEHRYLPQIRDIIHAENDLPAQYALLRRQHDAEEMTDEFLVTFARVSYYSSHWSSLRQYAEQMAQKTENQTDIDLVERMKNAEVEAVKATTFSPGKDDTKASLMKAGSVAISTFLIVYFHDDITNAALSALGFATEATKFLCQSCGF